MEKEKQWEMADNGKNYQHSRQTTGQIACDPQQVIHKVTAVCQRKSDWMME